MSAPGVSGRSAVLRRRLSGLAFLLVIAGLLALSVGFYNKAFTPVVRVALEADRIGNQLSAPTDVKLRGLIVGEVRKVSSTGDGATLDLALDPEHMDLIPADVEAQLLPKTLFGEKYVSLVIPEGSSDEPLAEGDVITQDRSETARETEEALNNLLPLLQALRPQDLSVTLNALSGALRGRGDRLGENLELVDEYLRGFNPEVATLGEDFRGLADFADTLDQAAPDLLAVLDDLSAVNRSLVDQEQALNSFLTSTTGFSRETDGFLRDNEARLVALAADSLPPLEVFAKYAPEYPCLAEGLARSNSIIGDTFGGRQPGLHITLEVVQARKGYLPGGDEPAYRDDRGPACYGLPSPQGTAPDINFQDGYNDGNGPGDSTTRSSSRAAPASSPSSGLSSPAAQHDLLSSLLGPVMGLRSDEVPDLAHLLFGPLARGTEVGLR
jgi:phospholipid/cholesterol/gamma-HCH transport system substrate-binding protein